MHLQLHQEGICYMEVHGLVWLQQQNRLITSDKIGPIKLARMTTSNCMVQLAFAELLCDCVQACHAMSAAARTALQRSLTWHNW